MIHDSGSCSFGDFHQNDDILVLVMLLAAGFRRGGNQGLDIPARHLTLGFELIRVLIALLNQEDINRPEVSLCIAAQVIFRNVVHVCNPFVHGFREHFIHSIHNTFAGTVIVHEEDPALCRVRIIRICPAFMLKQIWFGMTESVDGLLDVTDHEELMSGSRQGLDDSVLNAGNILAFVHIDVFELCQQLIPFVRIGHNAVSNLLHVGIVNCTGFQFLLLILCGGFSQKQFQAPQFLLNNAVQTVILLVQHSVNTLNCCGEYAAGAFHAVTNTVKLLLPGLGCIPKLYNGF